MEYREIVAITGIGGLFQLLTTKSDGAIVKNLSDKSTKFISARLHNVTPLESIEIYTTGDNVRLHNVFQKMKDSEGTTAVADAKSDNNTIKKYFSIVFPDFDEDRVYVSDMKKMLKWYELLKANDLLNFEKQEAAEEGNTSEEVEIEEKAPAKKATKKAAETEEGTEEKAAPKKTAAKKTAKKAAETEEGTEEKAAPKKTARKKKTEE